MSKKPFPIESRLLLSISKHGGTATLTQIRLDCYGRLTSAAFERARVDLADLVVSEKSRSKGSKRPTTRLSLTLRGWAAVQHLRPGWQPRRLAVDVLKAWLAELQAEKVPWAVGFIRDAEDAYRWRHHEAEVKDKKRKCKLRTLRKPRSSWPVANAIPSTPRISSPIPAPIPTPSVLPPGGFCESCHMNSESCSCTNPVPGRAPSRYRGAHITDVQAAVQGVPSDSDLAARIRAAGFTVRDGNVQYGGDRWIPAEEWMQKEGWRLS